MRCYCRCHSVEHPDIAETWGVPVNDPVEREVACTRCGAAHTLEREYRRPDYLPPTPWTQQGDGSDGPE